MNISLGHFLKISGSEAELLAGLDGLNLVSTYMSNERWRDRQILHLFFGGGVFANTVLALPAGPPHRCIVLFDLPFTDKSFVLPMWMSQLSMDLAAISTLMAVLLWVMLLIKRWRIRDVQS
jgi:hypothetical protein